MVDIRNVFDAILATLESTSNNSNGRRGIVGFGKNNVLIGHNNGNGTTFSQAVISDFCTGARLMNRRAFTFRRQSDMSGDGRTDIIGCGDSGVHMLSNWVVNNFGAAQGRRMDKHLW